LARQITEAFPWDTASGAAFKARVRVVPMAVIARQLGHSDTRMTERHYAHLAPIYVADTIRANFPRLTEAQGRTVVPIERARRNRRQAGL
jgi:hypothetical protein